MQSKIQIKVILLLMKKLLYLLIIHIHTSHSFKKNNIILPRTFMYNWPTRLKIVSLVFIRPFQKASFYCRKSMICSRRAQRDGKRTRGERISCRSMIYTRPRNESINYLWTCKIYLRYAAGNRAALLPLEALPLEYALNIMAISTCSYKLPKTHFSPRARELSSSR